MLQAVWGGVAGVLSQLSAVVSADRAEQPADVVPHPSPGFHPSETRSGPQEEFFEFQVPDQNGSAVQVRRQLSAREMSRRE
ncbi:hypothetical protein [Streptomyces sp. NPDC093707]|uniref:hypothetical protein n=1 Tax=Streptomyces sp. NPDC093707 TaxID=3154984 RepID=UPI00344D0ECD